MLNECGFKLESVFILEKIPYLPYLRSESPLSTHRALWYSNFNIGYTEHTPTSGGTSASQADIPKKPLHQFLFSPIGSIISLCPVCQSSVLFMVAVGNSYDDADDGHGHDGSDIESDGG